MIQAIVAEVKDAIRLAPTFGRIETSWSWWFRDSRGPAKGTSFTTEDFECYTGIEDGSAEARLLLAQKLGAVRRTGRYEWVRVR